MPAGQRAAGRRQRVRLRRDELPRRPRGVRARTAARRQRASWRGRRRRPGRSPEPASHSAPGTGPEAAKAPLRGALVVGAANADGLIARLAHGQSGRRRRRMRRPPPRLSAPICDAPERIAIDYGDAAELAREGRQGAARRSGRTTRPRGGCCAPAGHVPRPRTRAEGRVPLHRARARSTSNMLGDLRAAEPIVAEVFDEADRVMTPLLGRPLSPSYIFVDRTDPAAVAARRGAAEADGDHAARGTRDRRRPHAPARRLRHPARHGDGTQPGRVRAPSWRRERLSFGDALEAVSARGREMTSIARRRQRARWRPCSRRSARSNGSSETIDGYVVIANFNSTTQSVIGGATDAVREAVARCTDGRLSGGAATGQPRLPHGDRGAGQRAAPAALIRLNLPAARAPDRRERDGRVLPDGVRRRSRDARHARAAGRVARAVREGPADAVRRRGRGSSSRSARRRRCRASSMTCSGGER